MTRKLSIAGALQALFCSVTAGCAQVEVVPQPVVLPHGPLDVNAAVELALVNHPDARIAKQRIVQAASLIDEADSMFWPDVTLGESFSRTDRPSMVFAQLLDQGRFDSGLDFNDPGTVSNFRPTVGASVTLYDGGRRRAALDATEAGLGSSVAFERVVTSRLAFETARAWFQVHIARERSRLALQESALLGELLGQALDERELGVQLESEVQALELELAAARLTEAASADGELLAKSALRMLLGLGFVDSFEIDAAKAPPESPSPLPAVQELLERARFERPEIVRAEFAIEQAVAGVREAEAGYLPSLGLSGEFGFASQDGRLAHSNWLFGANLVQSITDTLRAPARVRARAAQLSIAHEQGRRALHEIEREVEAAWIDAAAAIRELQHARALLDQLRTEHARTTAEFELGATRRAQYLTSQLAIDRADSQVRLAQLRSALAQLAIEHAIGSLPKSRDQLADKP